MRLDDEEIDLALLLLRWARAMAVDSKGEPNAFSAAAPVCKWGMSKVDTLIDRLAQRQLDRRNGDA